MLQLRMQALPGPGGQMYRSTQHPPPPPYALSRNQTRLLVPVQPTHTRVRTRMCMQAQQGSREAIEHACHKAKSEYHSWFTRAGVHIRFKKLVWSSACQAPAAQKTETSADTSVACC